MGLLCSVSPYIHPGRIYGTLGDTGDQSTFYTGLLYHHFNLLVTSAPNTNLKKFIKLNNSKYHGISDADKNNSVSLASMYENF